MDKDGFLLRCGERQALERLVIDIMARTPHGKWVGCRHFGLREFLEDARSRPERLQAAVHELNCVFDDLGIGIRAESIALKPAAEPGVHAFEVSLLPSNGGDKPFAVKVLT